MPGKVNPVIPEGVNRIAFKVIGNDLTCTIESEARQLDLNVFEPVIVQSIFESVAMLFIGMNTEIPGIKRQFASEYTCYAPRSHRLK